MVRAIYARINLNLYMEAGQKKYLSTQYKKVTQLVADQLVTSLSAEREGFEPPVPLSTPVFKTGVIDHSTISPLTCM